MLLRKKGRKVWIYRAIVNGRVWERTTGETDRRKAQEQVPRLQQRAQLHRERPGGSPKLAGAIVREVARLEQDVSAQQAERVSYALESFHSFAGDIELEKITFDVVEAYQRKRLAEVARSTVDKEISYVLKLLRLNGFRVDRPSFKRGRSTEVRHFTQDELRLFFAHCPAELRTLFLTMLVTGARPAELVPSARSSHIALLKSEVDPEGLTLTIRSCKVLPGGKTHRRVCPVSEDLMKAICEQARSLPGEHLFPSIQSLCHRFDRILKNAGIEKFDALGRKLVAHSFRHTYATLMAESVGNNPFVLKQALGHTQISTTDRYCHPKAPDVLIDFLRFI